MPQPNYLLTRIALIIILSSLLMILILIYPLFIVLPHYLLTQTTTVLPSIPLIFTLCALIMPLNAAYWTGHQTGLNRRSRHFVGIFVGATTSWLAFAGLGSSAAGIMGHQTLFAQGLQPVATDADLARIFLSTLMGTIWWTCGTFWGAGLLGALLGFIGIHLSQPQTMTKGHALIPASYTMSCTLMLTSVSILIIVQTAFLFFNPQIATTADINDIPMIAPIFSVSLGLDVTCLIFFVVANLMPLRLNKTVLDNHLDAYNQQALFTTTIFITTLLLLTGILYVWAATMVLFLIIPISYLFILVYLYQSRYLYKRLTATHPDLNRIWWRMMGSWLLITISIALTAGFLIVYLFTNLPYDSFFTLPILLRLFVIAAISPAFLPLFPLITLSLMWPRYMPPPLHDPSTNLTHQIESAAITILAIIIPIIPHTAYTVSYFNLLIETLGVLSPDQSTTTDMGTLPELINTLYQTQLITLGKLFGLAIILVAFALLLAKLTDRYNQRQRDHAFFIDTP